MSNVVNTANKYVGNTGYTWGGSNLDAGSVDCSGFTQGVYEKNGVNIGRDTEAQWTNPNGSKVENPEEGDLVFFANTYNSGHTDGVSHVGIYAGNGKFIHNSSSKGVTVSDLSDPYYAGHYLGAKRFDGAGGGVTNTSNQIAGGYGGSSGSSGSSGASEGNGVKWWGDIVIVVICALLIVGGLGSLALGVVDISL